MNAPRKPAFRVMVIDDEPTIRLSLRDALRDAGFVVSTAQTGEEAQALLETEDPHVLVCDVRMPGMSGIDLLSSLQDRPSRPEMVLMTAYGNVEHAVAAMKMGAHQYVVKPFSNEKIVRIVATLSEVHALRVEVSSLRERLSAPKGEAKELLGKSAAWQRVVEQVNAVADSDVTVLIEGSSGTGKELVADALHNGSSRVDGPFIKVNCAALPPTLMESELFGHTKGAFTGASHDTKGRFELADEGTLLLDEVDEIPLDVQVKLLRVLQERVFERVGSATPIPVDVRILATTKSPLETLVERGVFREDLFYRLSVVNVTLPPLTERREDIPLLVGHFIRGCCTRSGKTLEGISPQAMHLLMRYPYPGNVRELEHIVESACAMTGSGYIEVERLPPRVREFADSAAPIAVGYHGKPLKEAVRDFERSYLEYALRDFPGNRTELARAVGLSRKSLWKKLSDYGLQSPTSEDDDEESD